MYPPIQYRYLRGNIYGGGISLYPSSHEFQIVVLTEISHVGHVLEFSQGMEQITRRQGQNFKNYPNFILRGVKVKRDLGCLIIIL